jgi:hypothetical protein
MRRVARILIAESTGCQRRWGQGHKLPTPFIFMFSLSLHSLLLNKGIIDRMVSCSEAELCILNLSGFLLWVKRF